MADTKGIVSFAWASSVVDGGDNAWSYSVIVVMIITMPFLVPCRFLWTQNLVHHPYHLLALGRHRAHHLYPFLARLQIHRPVSAQRAQAPRPFSSPSPPH